MGLPVDMLLRPTEARSHKKSLKYVRKLVEQKGFQPERKSRKLK
jgi:hypothetical protein